MKTATSILDRVLDAEREYLCNGITRDELGGLLRLARREYDASLQKPDETRSRLALVFVLRRIRQRIVLENKIVDIVDAEAASVVRAVHAMLSETAQTAKRSRAMHESSIRPRTRANFPMDISQLLRSWLKENMDNPYPSDAEKAYLCQKTGLGPAQINNWFINARRRILPFMKGKFVNFQ